METQGESIGNLDYIVAYTAGRLMYSGVTFPSIGPTKTAVTTQSVRWGSMFRLGEGMVCPSVALGLVVYRRNPPSIM